MVSRSAPAFLEVPAVFQGRVVFGRTAGHTSRLGAAFAHPELDLDALVLPRSVPGPAFDTPLSDIIELLEETGRRLALDSNGYLSEALEAMARVSPLSRRILENCYRSFPVFFSRERLELQVERELGREVLDGWVPVPRSGRPLCHVRAFPPRLVHVIPGNGPQAAAVSIIRSSLTKGVHLFKLPGNDLFTTTAILRTMADVDCDHPTIRSLSAAYWRGGDTEVESLVYRAQYFDKLVAWGGHESISHALRYIGPGFELVSFDPKVSISLIGGEAFADAETLRKVAALAATDTTLLNQDACAASRYHFVEGGGDEVDSYCEALAPELAIDRPLSDAVGPCTPAAIRTDVEVLKHLEGLYRVWGDYSGGGLVIRSDDPVDFHPAGKTVNVVGVPSLVEATQYATVATQTVGVYPSWRKAELRDGLASRGVQRVVSLGTAIGLADMPGLPHDGMLPLQRMIRWVTDEGV